MKFLYVFGCVLIVLGLLDIFTVFGWESVLMIEVATFMSKAWGMILVGVVCLIVGGESGK